MIAVILAVKGSSAGSPQPPPTLRTRALPGFDIDLPSGDIKDVSSEYSHGRLTISPPNFGVQVGWEPGTIKDLDLDRVFNLLAPVLAEKLGGTAHDVRRNVYVANADSLPSRSWTEGVGGGSVWMTQLDCGTRRLTITTGGRGEGVEPLHKQIVGTLRCRPDPAKERATGDVPVVVDTVERWARLPRKDLRTNEDLQLTNGKSVFVARAVAGANLDEVMAMVVQSPAHIGERQGDHWPLELNGNKGFAMAKVCPELNVSLLLEWISFKPDPGDGLALLRRARCRRRNEAAQVWPDLQTPPPASTPAVTKNRTGGTPP
jgi:hypothetical protein